MTDDSRLRDRFALMRSDDAARTPAFAQLLQRARPGVRYPAFRLRAGAVAVTASLLAVFAAVTLWQVPHVHTTTSGTAVPPLAAWRSPTEFLLDTPGREVLRLVPEFGRPLSRTPDLSPHLDDMTPARPAEQESHT
jgi:hypothetical protein